jgi:adenosylcobinamide-phosphate synthase
VARVRRWRDNAEAVALGLLVDQVLGEPPGPHPVALFGSLMQAVEGPLYRDDRAAGVAHAGIGLAVGVAAGRVLRSTSAATALTVAGRGLGDAAGSVQAALAAGDLDVARALLPALAGRDPTGLDDKELARAAVESVAENTVDGIVAPALWALAAGAPGACGYRAANTLDSMVGHHSARYRHYGWASARLDDAANWIPARATAALVCAARPAVAGRVLRTVRRDAGGHPSPNAGVAEAAFAAALGLRLGGVNRYGERVEVRPSLGEGRPPEPADIGRSVRLSRDVVFVLAGGLAALAALAHRRPSRR